MVVRRQPNVIIPGYEHSERSEFPNPATSSKQIIPLEPDFSQISDLSVMIDPPNSTDISLTRPSRKEQSKRDHKSKKRRRHRSSSSSTSTSRSDFWVLRGERKIQRDLNTLTKREEDDRWRLLLHQIPPNLSLTLIDIQGLINLPRLFKRQLQYNLRIILIQSITNLLIMISLNRILLSRTKSPIRKLYLKSGTSNVR